MNTPTLLRRLLRYRWRQALLTVALVASVSAPLAAAGVFAHNARLTIERATAASLGGYAYALQVVDGDAVYPLFRQREDLVYVRDEPVTVSGDGAQVAATVRTAGSAGARLAELRDGTWPTGPGQVAVSPYVADALDAAIGTEVTLASGRAATVVGLTASPAVRDESVAFTVDPALPIESATTLLTNSDVLRDPDIAALGDQRLFTLRTVGVLADDASRVGSSLLTRGLALPWYAAAAVLAAVVLPLLGLMARRARDDVAALTAAGMGRLRAHRLLGSAALLLVAAGFVAGCLLGVVVLWLARDPASSLVGQRWATVSVPMPFVAGLAAAGPGTIALTVLLAPMAAGRTASMLRWRPRVRRGRAVALIGSWLVVAALWMIGIIPYRAAGVWGGVAAVTLAIALGYPRVADRSVARRRVVEAVAASMLPVTVASAGVVWAATSVAAESEHDAISSVASSGVPQPPGSLIAYEVPGGATASIVSAYRELGGRDVVEYVLPRESESQVRAAAAMTVGCMDDLGTQDPFAVPYDCVPDDTVSNVNTFALSESVGVGEVRADPTLIEDGKVGVLVFQPGSPTATSTDQISATPDPLLGGNMPGAVINPRSPLAVRLGMTPSEGRLVAFVDFGELTVHEQARLRSALGQVAPAAQIGEDGEYYAFANERRMSGRVVAVVGSLVVVLIIGFGGGAVVAAGSVTRRNVLDVPALRSERGKLRRRLAFVPSAAVTLATLCGLGTAWIVGVHDGSGFGVAWLLPTVSALAAWLLVARAYTSMPRRP